MIPLPFPPSQNRRMEAELVAAGGGVPDVSVIVPTYRPNRVWLAECLKSIEVAAQAIPEWTFEFLVVDDGCPHGTAQYLLPEFPMWRLLVQENRGLAAARNLGISASRGRWLHFVDDDDRLESAFYKAVAAAVRDQTSSIVYGNWTYFTHQYQTKRTSPNAMTASRMLPCGNCFPVNAVVVQAELVKHLGGFNSAFKAMEDWDVWLRCVRFGATLTHAPEAWAEVRIQPYSMSTRQAAMHGWMTQVCEQESQFADTWIEKGTSLKRFAASWGIYLMRSDRLQKGWGSWWAFGRARWGAKWMFLAAGCLAHVLLRKNRSPHATLLDP